MKINIVKILVMLSLLCITGCEDSKTLETEHPYVVYTVLGEKTLNYYLLDNDDKYTVKYDGYLHLSHDNHGAFVLSETSMKAKKYIDTNGIEYKLNIDMYEAIALPAVNEIVYYDSSNMVQKYNLANSESTYCYQSEYNIWGIWANSDGSTIAVLENNNSGKLTDSIMTGRLIITGDSVTTIVDDVVVPHYNQNIIASTGEYIYVDNIDTEKGIGVLHSVNVDGEKMQIISKASVNISDSILENERGKGRYTISEKGDMIIAHIAPKKLFISDFDGEELLIDNVDSYIVSGSGEVAVYLQETDKKYKNDLYVLRKGSEPTHIASGVAQLQAIDYYGESIAYNRRNADTAENQIDIYMSKLYLYHDNKETIITENFRSNDVYYWSPSVFVADKQVIYKEFSTIDYEYLLYNFVLGNEPVLIDRNVNEVRMIYSAGINN